MKSIQAYRHLGLYSIITIVFITGCGSAQYKLHLKGHLNQYKEVYPTSLSSTLATALGQPVTITEGDDNKLEMDGYGFSFGLTEVLPFGLITRISYYSLGYNTYSYSLLVGGLPFTMLMDVEQSGIEASLGYQFWWFEPHIGYRIDSYDMILNTNGVESTAQESYMLFGGGLNMNIPLGDAFTIYASADYLTPTKSQDSDVSIMVFGLGIEITLDTSTKRKKKSKK
ncbi:MAG: hypothetical protein ISR65_07575 [Bacteriovoracaceae bacterium]|nr:hypothetical protein [Bacteriovoracaceae bacterium]